VAVATALIAREAVLRSGDPRRLAKRVLGLFVLTGLFLSAVLFRQVLSGGGNLVERLVLERGRSLFLDPNYFATYIVMALAVTLGFFLQTGAWAGRLIWGGAALVMLAAVGLSLSRAGYLATMALGAVTLYYVWRDRTRIARFGALVALTLALTIGVSAVYWRTLSDRIDPEVAGRRLELLFSGRDYSVMKRVLILKGAARMIERNPFTGVGLGQFEAAYDSYKLPSPFASHEAACHNTPVRLLAETGVVGFVPFVLAMLALLGRIIGGFRPLGRLGLSPLYFGVAASILGFGLMALTLDQLFRFHLWVMLGLALGMAEWARGEERGG
jgi:O-antigen ligase